MSEENLAIVRTLMGAFRRRDNEVMRALMSPEVVWDATRFATLIPDLAGVYQGADGTRDFWSRWLSSWQDLRFDFELRGAGDTVVALISNQRQWGRTTGIETEVSPYAWLYRLREGRIVEGCFFEDQAEALEAAGVRE